MEALLDSVIHAALLSPLPYPEPDRLARSSQKMKPPPTVKVSCLTSPSSSR